MLDLQPDLGQVTLDPKGIYRCILNLVSNAIDACDKTQGLVTITSAVDETDKRLRISVADNGCGISEEDLENVFKVFFSTKGSKGTGLGLGVTQKIIAEHGGDIKAESELEVGTRFIMGLPLDGDRSRK